MEEKIDPNLRKIIWIYNKLSESKKSMLIGTVNLLYGAQKIEEGNKDGNIESGESRKEKEEKNLLLDSTNNL